VLACRSNLPNVALELSRPAHYLPPCRRGSRLSAGVSRDKRRSFWRRDPYALLTVEHVAALLKVSKSWVYEHTRARGVPRAERLPHLKIGKYVRFEPRAVRAFVQRKCRVA
jgi:excisionase family DNA binding protein